MTNYRVKQNGLIVSTVTALTGSEALRRAIEEFGQDVTIEEDVENDLVEQEGTRDVRLMRSYKSKLFYVPRTSVQTELNAWLSCIDVVIHSIQCIPSYEERNPTHHYMTVLVLYSCPAETTSYKSMSEKLLANPNALKEVVAMLPDEDLLRFATALGATWQMYPDRNETRRNCINAIIVALVSPTKPVYNDAVKKARRHIPVPITTSDIDTIRAKFTFNGISFETLEGQKDVAIDGVPTIREWCDQVDYLLALLAFYGVKPE